MNIQQNFPDVSAATITTAQRLHNEFVRLGGMRHKLKNRLLAILPEIYDSGIWKKYAGSIEEYAGKYGDIARTTVRKRLRLEDNLDDLPCLKAVIEKVGVHKVAMVAKIATPETDQAFAENISNMSRLAVQSLSKELRAKGAYQKNGKRFCDQMNFADCASLGDMGQACLTGNQSQSCHAIPRTTKIELDEESTFLFMKLKTKLGKNLSDKEFLKLILKGREKQEFSQSHEHKQALLILSEADSVNTRKIEADNAAIARKSIIDDTFQTETTRTITDKKHHGIAKSTGRYICVSKKREIILQTNGKCAYPGCNLPCEVLHHADRYSESKNHDSIIPLCKIHHEFAHNNLIQNEIQPADQWRISIIRPLTTKISQADILYKKYRQKMLA
jgi:hypothetical protein